MSGLREDLIRMGRDMITHYEAGTVRLAEDVMRLDARLYTDPQRFEVERSAIFRNLPIMLAMSCELGAPGSYVTMDVASVPVLLVRGKDGQARAFLNACTHRGGAVAQGCGQTSRFVCRYHGWSFGSEGQLSGIAAAGDFGAVDKSAMGLRPFPTLEKAGMIWAILNPESSLRIEDFLGGYVDFLAQFGLENWTLVSRKTLPGPNWKLTFDAHLEFYHLPVLHRDSIGPGVAPRTLYHDFGPHQRLTRPDRSRPGPDGIDLYQIKDWPDADLPIESLMFGEWILFPNVSINTFYKGGRGVIVAQIFPGATVDASITVQSYLMEKAPDAAGQIEAERMADLLAQAVGTEDLPMSFTQQAALNSGALREICLGRNEGGLQQFHRWVEKIVQAGPDGPELFAPRT